MSESTTFFRIARGPLIGGAATTVVAVGTLWLTGELTSGEARHQLEATQPTIRFLCATVATAASTILALMVTALALTQGRDEAPDDVHFERLKAIAVLCSVALIGGIGMLMLQTVPFGESLQVAGGTYATLYYLVIILSSVLSGVMVTIVLLLYASLRGMLALVRPDLESADPGAEE